MLNKLWRMVAVVAVFGVFSYAESEPGQVSGSASNGETAAPVSSLLTADIKVGTGIENFDPSGVAESFPSSTTQLVGWTRISGAKEPTSVSHVWIHAGKEVARIDLAVKTAFYRTWSRITLAGRSGNWTFQVVDKDGNTVASQNFTVSSEMAQ